MSSQFLSALLLCAPALPLGLSVHLPKGVTSRPYLNMTLRLLREAGIRIEENEDRLQVFPGRISPPTLQWEADWTAASYPFALLALATEGSEMFLPGLQFSGFQGDELVAEWMRLFGVASQPTAEGLIIRRTDRQLPKLVTLDFRDHPDLAQTLVVLCALLGIPGRFSGLHTLAIKETDRTAALSRELAGMGVHFHPDPEAPNQWTLTGQINSAPKVIRTYEDHRMAMAFSLVAMRTAVRLDDCSVTGKSFPGWWRALEGAGFRMEAC